ncbi:DNA-protecting protein DprA, partial [Microbacterium arthrosphaerae]
MIAFDLSDHAARRAMAALGGDDDGARERYATVVWCHLIEPGDSVAGRLVAARGATAALEAVLDGAAP